MRTSTIRSYGIGNNTASRIKDSMVTRSQEKKNNRQDQVVIIVSRTMKPLFVVRLQELVSSVGHWTMQLGIAHSYKTKTTEISNRGKQALKYQLRTELDNLSSNNKKADNKHRTRMLVLHSSNRTEMHKGGRIGHSSKGGHTILIMLTQMLRVMLWKVNSSSVELKLKFYLILAALIHFYLLCLQR